MKKINILKKQHQFDNLIKTGKVLKNQSFVLYYKDNEKNLNRFGISVGKKLGNAVYRNEYKRKIRSIIDNNPYNIYTKKDFVIILRKSNSKKSYKELENDYNKLFNKYEREIK